MDDLKERYAEWSNFTDIRETAREKVMSPPGAKELREQINTKQGEVLKAQAELQMLKAQLVLTGQGEIPYRRADFDHAWGRKKTALKLEVETLMAEEIQSGTSIPKIMRELQCKNPNWLYEVKSNIGMYRGAAKEDMAQTKWEWSDVTAVHRYALGCATDSSEWAYVLLKGAEDTALEGEQCMFDYQTGYYISGNRAVFEDVTDGTKAQRSQMLAQVLDGSYDKKVRRDINTYFTN